LGLDQQFNKDSELRVDSQEILVRDAISMRFFSKINAQQGFQT
jgi:hypothetical protein